MEEQILEGLPNLVKAVTEIFAKDVHDSHMAGMAMGVGMAMSVATAISKGGTVKDGIAALQIALRDMEEKKNDVR